VRNGLRNGLRNLCVLFSGRRARRSPGDPSGFGGARGAEARRRARRRLSSDLTKIGKVSAGLTAARTKYERQYEPRTGYYASRYALLEVQRNARARGESEPIGSKFPTTSAQRPRTRGVGAPLGIDTCVDLLPALKDGDS
jgi:hypothetical protein